MRELDDYRRDLGERFFAMEVVPVPFDDGAAVGAALNGAISAGLIPLDQRRSIIEHMIQEHA